MIRPLTGSTLFPYTTLFRSPHLVGEIHRERHFIGVGLAPADVADHRVGGAVLDPVHVPPRAEEDRKSTRLNSSHMSSSYAVFCLKKKNHVKEYTPTT